MLEEGRAFELLGSYVRMVENIPQPQPILTASLFEDPSANETRFSMRYASVHPAGLRVFDRPFDSSVVSLVPILVLSSRSFLGSLSSHAVSCAICSSFASNFAWS